MPWPVINLSSVLYGLFIFKDSTDIQKRAGIYNAGEISPGESLHVGTFVCTFVRLYMRAFVNSGKYAREAFKAWVTSTCRTDVNYCNE